MRSGALVQSYKQHKGRKGEREKEERKNHEEPSTIQHYPVLLVLGNKQATQERKRGVRVNRCKKD